MESLRMGGKVKGGRMGVNDKRSRRLSTIICVKVKEQID
jgi:hypothetical protein